MVESVQPRQPSQISIKTVLTVALSLVGVAALVAALWKGRSALELTVASVVIAVAVDHLVQRLEHRRVKRGAAIAIVSSALLIALAGILLLFIPPAVRQAGTLADQLPELKERMNQAPLYQKLNERFRFERKLEEKVQDVNQQARQNPERYADAVMKAIGGVVNAGVSVATVIFLSIFMLVFGGDLVRRSLEEARPDRRERYVRVLAKSYRSVGGYLGGLGFICLVNASLTTTFLAICRVPFFLPLGMLSGLSSLVPYAGPITAGLTITLVVLLAKGVPYGIATAVYYVLYGMLEGNILSPMVFKRTVHINPLVTLLALLFLGEVGGVPGAIIAVPAAAAAQIVVQEILALRRERSPGLLGPQPEPMHDPKDAPMIAELSRPAADH